jgi:radical SAM protein with 4Fe4S-binding SPASM domain
VKCYKALTGTWVRSLAVGVANSFACALRNQLKLKPTPEADQDLCLRNRIQQQFDKGHSGGFLPRQLAIETSAFCNARCVMCPHLAMKRKKGIMADGIHQLIVDKVARWGAPISLITHAGLGEPLLDGTLYKKIGYEKEVFKEAKVVVYTNAGLLDARRSEQLLQAGLDRLSISLNGFKKETYEAVMKIPYDRTMHNITTFLSLAEKRDPPPEVHVSLIPTEFHSIEEIEDYRLYWNNIVDAVIIPPWISWGNFFQHQNKGEQWPCRYIWDVLQIDWDGTVAMCCEDYDTKFPLGDLTQQLPQEIYNSPQLQQQRKNHVEGNFMWPEICKNCVETFDVARAFWETADLIQPRQSRSTDR